MSSNSLTKLVVINLLCIFWLQGCGGSRVEYIEDCKEKGRKLVFTEQMAYLSGFEKHNTDPLTYEIGRSLWISVFDSGNKQNIEQFGRKVTYIDQKHFTITACFKVVTYGYVLSFAGSGYNAYVLESADGIRSTTIASLVKDKHWKNIAGNKERLENQNDI